MFDVFQTLTQAFNVMGDAGIWVLIYLFMKMHGEVEAWKGKVLDLGKALTECTAQLTNLAEKMMTLEIRQERLAATIEQNIERQRSKK